MGRWSLKRCQEAGLNRRHEDFQSSALPAELSRLGSAFQRLHTITDWAIASQQDTAHPVGRFQRCSTPAMPPACINLLP